MTGSRGGGAWAMRRGHGRDVTPAGSGRTRTWRPAASPASRRAPARRPGNEPRVRLGAPTLRDAVMSHGERGGPWAGRRALGSAGGRGRDPVRTDLSRGGWGLEDSWGRGLTSERI